MASAEPGGDAAKKRKKRFQILNREIVLRKLGRAQEQNARGGGSSPMLMLREIFEESPDKERFVGDTMFWRYFEDIDINRIYHTNSVEYRNLRLMFWETLFYLFLLFIFTLYVYQLQSRDVFDARAEQISYWGGCDMGGQCKISEVNSISSFWKWMEGELVPRAFTDYAASPLVANISTSFASNDFPLVFSPRFVGPQMSNVLLGSIRVRQLRVKRNEGCAVTKLMSHVYPDCYGPFNARRQSTDTYKPRYAPTYLRTAFTWQSADVTRQVPILGKMADYGGDGFMEDLPANRSDSAIMVRDLWDWGWINRGTRAVIIELSTMNINSNVIVNSAILFEFGPTGFIQGSVKSNAARVFLFTPSTHSGAPLNVFLVQLVLLLVFLAFTFWVFGLMYKTCANFLGERPLDVLRRSTFTGVLSVFFKTLLNYFKYGWNLVDLVILALFYSHMGFRLSTYAKIGQEPALAPDVIGHPNTFMPFCQVIQPLTLGTNVLSVLAMLVWIKLFKYLCMSSYFRLLVRILERCAARLLVFAALLLVVFFGFAVAFFVGFGSTEREFASISSSFLVLFFYLLDGFTIRDSWFGPGRDGIMPFVFTVYTAVIYFVLLTIFVAVVLDVYALSGQLRRNSEGPNPMATFIYTYANMMLGVSLVRDEADEDMKSEDLAIRLELLPGIVRRKWVEKKRNMQRVASETFAGMEIFPEDKESNGQLPITDWMLPSSRTDVLDKMLSSAQQKPIPLYDIPKALLQQEVSWSQLQRMMDEDPTLPLLLGTKKAVEVIRRFKRTQDHHGDDAEKVLGRPGDISAVKAFQGSVFGRIDQLEKLKLDEQVPNVPEIKELAEEMSGAINEVQNQFRGQLTGIIEATATLFEHLVELTQGIDAVRDNHESVLKMVRSSAAPSSMSGSEVSRRGRGGHKARSDSSSRR